jgi:hypothetical protein
MKEESKGPVSPHAAVAAVVLAVRELEKSVRAEDEPGSITTTLERRWQKAEESR